MRGRGARRSERAAAERSADLLGVSTLPSPLWASIAIRYRIFARQKVNSYGIAGSMTTSYSDWRYAQSAGSYM